MSIKSFRTYLDEASYEGNMGAVEVMKFYQSATDSEIDKLERFIARQDWSKAWKLVQKVTGVNLMGKAFESTVLSEIGDASAKPYRLRYQVFRLDYRISKFRIENEDFDTDDPKRNWQEIDMFIETQVEFNGILTISFGRDYTFDSMNTLDIGLKYLFRIMSTVIEHVKQHIEDYNSAIEIPLEGLAFSATAMKKGMKSSRGANQRIKLYKAYIEKNIRKIAPRAKVVYSYEGDVIVDFN